MRETTQRFGVVWLTTLIATVLVMLGWAATVYPVCQIFERSSLRVSKRHQHMLFWGGLRGALALALVLGLPPDVPRREEIVTVSFAVVAFSIFLQGFTIAPLLRAVGEISAKPELS